MRVWDLAVRILHWTLVTSVAVAALSTFGLGLVRWHEPAGYVALATVALRLVWGVVGGGYALFSQFIRGPRVTVHYALEVLHGTAPRYIGHNPLGAWMIVALMVCVAALASTGWLYTTDAFWGEAWLDQLHTALAWGLLGLVCLHVAGVLYASGKHRDNLVLAMFSGRKVPPRPQDVD